MYVRDLGQPQRSDGPKAIQRRLVPERAVEALERMELPLADGRATVQVVDSKLMRIGVGQEALGADGDGCQRVRAGLKLS